jgi:transcriptional/translational regulatory protein YebC/TACO1
MSEWDPAGWQCGMGVIDECKDLNVQWGSDVSFRNLVDEIVSTAEFLIKYGVQLIADQLTDNLKRGINALRCMINNFGSNTWNLIAAAYHAADAFGMGEMLRGYLDMGYEYVCTCTIDAAGLAEMMGASQGSSAIFSSCSESGANAKIQQNEAKA